MRDARRIKCFENFQDLPVRLLHGPSGPWAGVITAAEPTPGGPPAGGPTRNGPVRTKGDQMSARREPLCPSTGILACPLTLASRSGCRGQVGSVAQVADKLGAAGG